MKKLILSLALLVGLASTSALAAPQGLSYLNGDADILVHFDFQRLQKSQTFKDIMAMAMSNPRAKSGLDEIKTNVGVDVLKDVDSVTVQVKAPPKGKGRATVLGYVQGRFAPKTILAAMKTSEAKIEEVKAPWGVIYQNPSEPMGFAFVSGGMIFGDPELIKAHKKGAFKGNLAATSQKFGDNAQDIWAVVKMNKDMSAELASKNPMLAQFAQIVGSLDFKPGLHLNVRATSKDPSGPKMLAQMGQGQLAAMSKSPQAAMFGAMMKKISIKAEANDLVLDIPLNQQDVNQIKMMVGMMLMSFQQKAASAPGIAPGMPPATRMPPKAPAVKLAPAPAPK
jgi:hypothetical protein